MKKVVLFGCGAFGRKAYDELKNNIIYIFDNDNSKWGKDIGVLKIQNPSELQNYKEYINLNCIVLVAVAKSDFSYVYEQIRGYDINCDIVEAEKFVEENCVINIENLIDIKNMIDDVENRSDLKRYINIKQLLMNIINIDGNIAECGVYRGDSASVIDKLILDSNKKLYLLDTFEGMPKTNPDKDLHRAGDFCDTSLEYVKNKLSKYSDINIYLKGLFNKNFSNLIDERFSLVHIDCDIYSGVKECCEFFYNRLNKFGIMLFDDYGFYSCPGAKQAVDEFFEDKIENIIILETGQAFIVKR